jgi:NCS1 family nucleobase:cation symporter-1
LARYAKRPRDTLPLPIGIVLSKPVVVFFGMMITAAGYKQFGKVRCSSRGGFLLGIMS